MSKLAKAEKGDGPATSITIPVVPSLVTVGNIAVTSTALAVSSGVVGPVVGAVALAGGIAMWRHHKGQRPGSRSFGVRRSRSALSRAAASPGGRSRAGRAGGIGGKSGRHGGIGGKSGRHGGIGGKAGRHGGLGGKSGRYGGLLGRAGRRLGSTRVGRAARRAGMALTPAGRAMRGAMRGVDRGFRGVGGGLSRVGRFAGRAAGWFGRFLRRATRSDRKGRIDPSHDNRYNRRWVGSRVNEPQIIKDPPRPNPKPKPSEQKREIPVASGNGPNGNRGPNLSGSQLAEVTKAFTGQVANIHHGGALETLAEAQDMPTVIGMFADSIRYRLEEYRRSSIKAPYIQALLTVSLALDQVADMAGQLGPAFMAEHKDLVENLLHGQDPKVWDTSSNGM